MFRRWTQIQEAAINCGSYRGPFSATHIMLSMQQNLSNDEIGQVLYETMFFWDEFSTQGIDECLNNTLWTVALVSGFFKQVKLSISGKHFILTDIVRRSRYYAGTGYSKRGVNDKGTVANGVETGQIVWKYLWGTTPETNTLYWS